MINKLVKIQHCGRDPFPLYWGSMGDLVLKPAITPVKSEFFFGLEPLEEFCQGKRGVIFADESIASTHGAVVQGRVGFDLIPVPSGEEYKSRETKETLENELLIRKLGRETWIIALGGGVTTDLVAFLASTYMRGVPLVLIPTTLLAMVDAAIGGKTGVDTPYGKNLVGTFYLPKAVFVESKFLKSLPPKQMKNGLSEVLKYGLIANRAIWERCLHWENEIEFLIHASIECKLRVVEADFEEKSGLRRILNFGHTVGHALELLSDFQMAHGEAVALGCMAESYLSYLEGYLQKEALESILGVYRKLGYAFKPVAKRDFLDAIRMDKKAIGGEPRFVLIDQIGRSVPFNGEYCSKVKHLERMIEWMNGNV